MRGFDEATFRVAIFQDIDPSKIRSQLVGPVDMGFLQSFNKSQSVFTIEILDGFLSQIFIDEISSCFERMCYKTSRII